MAEREPSGSASTTGPSVDPWWRTAVVYQLYVRSFADGNGDGIGDLAGIRQHLGHIASLGADAIWLNPCYPSPQLDHGYDVADYFAIEPDYGDLDEFDRLVADAAERGIRIVMDVVPNHCSVDHEWFRAAVAAGPGSAERERFYFRDGVGPGGAEPPNDWVAMFGGSAWTRVDEPDGTPGQWYLGVFTPHQPDLCWDVEDVAEHFDRMLEFWFDRGVAGFRVDAVQAVDKDLALPQERRTEHRRPPEHPAWRRWRTLVDRYAVDHPGTDPFLVAEVWSFGDDELMAQFVNDAEFHGAFAFDLLLAPWTATAMADAITRNLASALSCDSLPSWTMNNHDVQRSVSRYGRVDARERSWQWVDDGVDDEVDVVLGQRRARAAAMVELALPGAVYLYAGEELGLPEVLDLPDEARTDPVFFGTGGARPGRDGCRVPLPWTAAPAGAHGFSPGSAAAPWLPQPHGWGDFAADRQEGDRSSVLALFRDAGALRRSHADLRTAPLEWLVREPDLMAFRRGGVVVALNTSDAPVRLPVDGEVLLCSAPQDDPTAIPANAAVWVAG